MEDPFVNAEPPVTEQATHRDRAVDHFVFLVTCGFLAPPFIASVVLSRTSADDNVFTIFAPFVAALVLIAALMLIEFVERRMAGSRLAWPPALFGLPFACTASGLAFSFVDPGHHWWRDGLAGVAWGTTAAVIGWQRWRGRAGAIGSPARDAV
jgi:hypothetical protein